MISYSSKAPSPSTYRCLFKSAGWGATQPLTNDRVSRVIENTWYWISAFDGDRLVGMGRLLSDGVLYALVCDLIVLPEYQGQGIGRTILQLLQKRCVTCGLERVWLMAAAGRKDFYALNGFEARPGNAPGMEMKNADGQNACDDQ